jgi:SNF2 family DNA or RNA helicase
VRGGTLVVCNVSLVGQWQSEMKKVLHASNHLKVHEVWKFTTPMPNLLVLTLN